MHLRSCVDRGVTVLRGVQATGKKKLVIAGIVTDVCVAFVALSALKDGFEVYVVTDCSGTFNKDVRDAALMRMVQAGACRPTPTCPCLAERACDASCDKRCQVKPD
jgi:isochorismate hydrolase